MTEPVGIIHPPLELRGIVDSTAKYVAKNGGAFEERIMREHKGKPKFSFLFPNDPFNAYYKYKVKELRNSFTIEAESKRPKEGECNNQSRQGDSSHEDRQTDASVDDKKDTGQADNYDSQTRVEAPESDRSNQDFDEGSDQQGNIEKHKHEIDEANQTKDAAPGVKTTLNEYMNEITLKLEEPPNLNFLANPASFITHFESDIIKSTAKFIATYGRPFLLELVSQEQGNPHFDFLRPQHGQFPYMTKLIMQYALIQNPPLDILEQLEKDSTCQRHILDRCKMRAEWNKMLEVKKKKREEAEEREKLLYSQIDWQDFVVVETIDYHYDEVGEYPPTTADQVGTRLLRQQRKEDLSAPEEMDIDMDVDSDNESAGSDQETAKTSDFKVPESSDIPAAVIRRDYDPKAVTRVVTQTENYFVSPITNERIPVDKIHEHVRYNLADPRYLEKKEKSLQEKINEGAVFASGSQIQDSLKNLAERRTDIFGMNEEEAAIGRRICEEEKEQTKDNKLLWDGHKSSLKRKKLS